ncbi:TetR/AcrR family transcriptional regulator [Nocardia sp. IBHARD005]|uniref:TetR/AcrR family transcriptional regulator n=1 Tax=Nocardia sp. IBHARD005 TaxID=3457765 RepID=UPI004059BCBA
MTEVPVRRRYNGLAPVERTRQRRIALLDAALELYGTDGYQGTSVKRLCQQAGLTERYFYESFGDREECLAALYDGIVSDMRAATLAAIAETTEAGSTDIAAIARSGLSGFIGYLTADPRRARVVLVEVVGVSPAMEQRRHGVLREFADIVMSVWSALDTELTPQRHHLTAVALVGGVNHLLVYWLMEGRNHDPDELTATCASLFTAAFQRRQEQ